MLVLPPGQSEHSYDPSPREVAALSGTDLSVRVGLEMDDWLERIVASASSDVQELELGSGVDPRRMTGNEVGELEPHEGEGEPHDEDEGEHREEEGEGEHHDEDEPHDEDEGEGEHREEEGEGEHHDEDEGEGEHREEEGEGEHHDEDEPHDEEEGEGEHHDEDQHHEGDHHEGDHHEPGEHHHRHGAHDPHFWLDPVRMQRVADLLAEAFAELKPAAADAFRRRAAEVKENLAALHTELEQAARRWSKKEIVTFHGSFGYFAERYGLRIAAVVEPFPGREPTPRYMREVLGALRATEAAALFSEPQLDRRPAEVIARESGKPLFELDPVGGTEGRQSYEALMRHNLSVLNRALR